MHKLKVFSGKTTDNFRVWHKLVKTDFCDEMKKFTVDADKIDPIGGRLKGEAFFRHQSCQECFEISYCRDTCTQYEEAHCDRVLWEEEDRQYLKKISALRYEGDINDYMIHRTYYKTNLGLKGVAWVT
jgi:hypothetical protein